MYNLVTDVLNYLKGTDPKANIDATRLSGLHADVLKANGDAHAAYKAAESNFQNASHSNILNALEGHIKGQKGHLDTALNGLKPSIDNLEREAARILTEHETAVNAAKAANKPIPAVPAHELQHLERLRAAVNGQNISAQTAQAQLNAAAKRLHAFAAGGSESLVDASGNILLDAAGKETKITMHPEQARAYQNAYTARIAASGVTDSHPEVKRLSEIATKLKALGANHDFPGVSFASIAGGAHVPPGVSTANSGIAKALGYNLHNATITKPEALTKVAAFQKALSDLDTSPVASQVGDLRFAQSHLDTLIGADGNKLPNVADDVLSNAQTAVKNSKEALQTALKANSAHPQVAAFTSAEAEVGALTKMGWAAGLNSGKVEAMGYGGAMKDNLFNSQSKGMSVVKSVTVGAGLVYAANKFYNVLIKDDGQWAKENKEPPSKALEFVKGLFALLGSSAIAFGGRARGI